MQSMAEKGQIKAEPGTARYSRAHPGTARFRQSTEKIHHVLHFQKAGASRISNMMLILNVNFPKRLVG